MNYVGICVRGCKSMLGCYFYVVEPGTGWGGTDIIDLFFIIEKINFKVAWSGFRLLMVSTIGEDVGYFVLDDELKSVFVDMLVVFDVIVECIGENCELVLVMVMFMVGVGGSLRVGVTENSVCLTCLVNDVLTRVICVGVLVYVWPGGGIIFMVDVIIMFEGFFGFVLMLAIVVFIEFMLCFGDYVGMGGHMDVVSRFDEIVGVD